MDENPAVRGLHLRRDFAGLSLLSWGAGNLNSLLYIPEKIPCSWAQGIFLQRLGLLDLFSTIFCRIGSKTGSSLLI
jgi:hypothetical protein